MTAPSMHACIPAQLPPAWAPHGGHPPPSLPPSLPPLSAAVQEMLAMVPQPVQAVLMCYPITDETEAAAKKGGQGGAPHRDVPQSPHASVAP